MFQQIQECGASDIFYFYFLFFSFVYFNVRKFGNEREIMCCFSRDVVGTLAAMTQRLGIQLEGHT